MNIPADLKYTKDHEWVRVEGNVATIGVTEYAQEQLGDVVFVDISTEGEDLDQEETFGTIEAVKTVSDMFMPLSGNLKEVNPALEDTPETVNKDPFGDGWMVKIEMSKPEELDNLMTADEYKELIAE